MRILAGATAVVAASFFLSTLLGSEFSRRWMKAWCGSAPLPGWYLAGEVGGSRK
jgi:hypothetical protein